MPTAASIVFDALWKLFDVFMQPSKNTLTHRTDGAAIELARQIWVFPVLRACDGPPYQFWDEHVREVSSASNKGRI